MKHPNNKQGFLFTLIFAACMCACWNAGAKGDPELKHPDINYKADSLQISRSDYADRLEGFWLA